MTKHTRVVLPILSESVTDVEIRHIYGAFLQALRENAGRRMDVRVLTAIYRAADVTQNSDAYVARVLVDMGLMAPRLALPGDFLDHVDACRMRERPLLSLPPSYTALLQHWVDIGDEVMPIAIPAAQTVQIHSFLVNI